MIKIYS